VIGEEGVKDRRGVRNTSGRTGNEREKNIILTEEDKRRQEEEGQMIRVLKCLISIENYALLIHKEIEIRERILEKPVQL